MTCSCLSSRAWIASCNLRDSTCKPFCRIASCRISIMRMIGILRLSIANFVPLIVPLARAEMAVQPCDLLVLEPRAEPFDGLRCQRNLGHEQDRVLALMQRVFDGLQIDFRLAAPGDAVNKDRFLR